MKKTKDKEIVQVLMIIAGSAKKLLKNIRKKDTLPTNMAEKMLDKLKTEYIYNSAAE